MKFLNLGILFGTLLLSPHFGVCNEGKLFPLKSKNIELIQFTTKGLIESSQKHIQSNRINSGINALQKRIQFNPADATAHHDLAVLYDQINDGFNSIVHTYKAKSLYKQFNDLRNLTLADRNLRLLFQKYNFHGLCSPTRSPLLSGEAVTSSPVMSATNRSQRACRKIWKPAGTI